MQDLTALSFFFFCMLQSLMEAVHMCFHTYEAFGWTNPDSAVCPGYKELRNQVKTLVLSGKLFTSLF